MGLNIMKDVRKQPFPRAAYWKKKLCTKCKKLSEAVRELKNYIL